MHEPGSCGFGAIPPFPILPASPPLAPAIPVPCTNLVHLAALVSIPLPLALRPSASPPPGHRHRGASSQSTLGGNSMLPPSRVPQRCGWAVGSSMWLSSMVCAASQYPARPPPQNACPCAWGHGTCGGRGCLKSSCCSGALSPSHFPASPPLALCLRGPCRNQDHVGLDALSLPHSHCGTAPALGRHGASPAPGLRYRGLCRFVLL